MTAKVLDTLYSLEREVVTIYGNCVGAGSADAVSLTYGNLEDHELPFAVGDSVTETVSTATGTVVTNSYTYATITFEALVDERFPFEVGETVTEGVTGYTAVVVEIDYDETDGTGTLTLGSVPNDFTGGQTLTGGTSGAVADGLVYTADAGTLLMTVDSGTFTGSDALTVVDGATAASDTATQGNYFYDPTSVKGQGIASIVAPGFLADSAATESTLVITLDDQWAGLLGFNACVKDATSPDEWQVMVISQPASVTGRSITIKTFKGGVGTVAGVLTSDDKLYFEIVVSNANGGTAGDLAG